METEDFRFRAGVRRLMCPAEDCDEGGKPVPVPLPSRGLDLDDGDEKWLREEAEMDTGYIGRLQPLLDDVNSRLEGLPLTIVHEELQAWAVNFYAGKSGGFTGRADPNRCPLVLCFTWPPHDSMGKMADGRMGLRMLSPTGFPSDTAFCALKKFRSVLKDGPMSFADLLSPDQLEKGLWSTIDIVSADREGNTAHSLKGVSDLVRQGLAAAFLPSVLPYLVDYASLWLVNYGAMGNQEFLSNVSHGAAIFPDTGVLVVAGYSSCWLSRKPEDMSNK